MHHNIFNPIYKKDYMSGFSEGLNPHSNITKTDGTKAFRLGFENGRIEYESLNGYIANGIPPHIVTNKILEDFLLAGMLGLYIDYEGYTPYQLYVLEKWYLSGIEKYDPIQSSYLIELLNKQGIEINSL